MCFVVVVFLWNLKAILVLILHTKLCKQSMGEGEEEYDGNKDKDKTKSSISILPDSVVLYMRSLLCVCDR